MFEPRQDPPSAREQRKKDEAGPHVQSDSGLPTSEATLT
jgi:hypothetical protein